MVGMSDAVDRARIAKIQGWSDSVRTSLMGSRVSEWKFDEAAGTTAMDTVGTNNGMLYNGPAWTTSSCVSGACLEFDGVDDYVDCGVPSSLENYTGSFTASAWVYNSADQYKGVVGQDVFGGRLWHIMTQAGKRARFRVFTTSAGSSYTSETPDDKLPLNAWTFVCGRYDADTKEVSVWADGVKYNPQTLVGDRAIGYSAGVDELFRIGNVYSTYFFNGLIDEVRIYNAAWTASIIRNQYLAGLDQLLAANQITQQEYRQRLAELDSTYAIKE